MVDSFHFIQLLRLREQQSDGGEGGQGHNLIYPDRLNELDRRILKEAFRQARKLQQKLRLDYQAA
jgi:CBS domain-containing protein